jgi:pimeloyl-ACP methyl ester carboxylesterase
LAAKDAIAREEPPLDPNDGERFFRINERMILECNEEAIWRHFVWENNMMEEDEANLLDPYTIEYDRLPEATSVAFFENQLFLHGTFDRPMKLLDHVDELRNVPTWMCQGLRDAVCPVQYGAQRLANYLIDAGVSTRMQFLDAGHEDTDTVIAKCLEDSVNDFVSKRKKTIYN